MAINCLNVSVNSKQPVNEGLVEFSKFYSLIIIIPTNLYWYSLLLWPTDMASGHPPLVSSTKENTNYARLCRLLIDVGTEALRNVFNAIHSPANLHKILSSSSPQYTTLKWLQKKEFWIPHFGESCPLRHEPNLISHFWWYFWEMYVVWVLLLVLATGTSFRLTLITVLKQI